MLIFSLISLVLTTLVCGFLFWTLFLEVIDAPAIKGLVYVFFVLLAMNIISTVFLLGIHHEMCKVCQITK